MRRSVIGLFTAICLISTSIAPAAPLIANEPARVTSASMLIDAAARQTRPRAARNHARPKYRACYRNGRKVHTPRRNGNLRKRQQLAGINRSTKRQPVGFDPFLGPIFRDATLGAFVFDAILGAVALDNDLLDAAFLVNNGFIDPVAVFGQQSSRPASKSASRWASTRRR